MKTGIITQPPKEPKRLAFKNIDPNLSGGLPTICVVNYPPKKPAGKKLSFVKITFLKSVTKNPEIFITGDMEIAIELVKIHGTILTDPKVEDQIKAKRVSVSANKKSLADFRKSKLKDPLQTRTIW